MTPVSGLQLLNKETMDSKTHFIRNIIFDVDGTLLDSKRDIAAAQHWVLEQLGVHAYSPEDIYPHIGKPLAEIFTALLPTQLHDRIPEAAEMSVSYYRPRALQTTTLFPGVKETIEILHLKGINLATATTKSTETTRRLLAHFGIARFFRQLQGSDRSPFKPDPFIINKIVTEQGWRKSETLMVGDAESDMNAGKNAGALTCGVTYGTLSRAHMEKLRPDFVIDSFPQLLSLL